MKNWVILMTFIVLAILIPILIFFVSYARTKSNNKIFSTLVAFLIIFTAAAFFLYPFPGPAFNSQSHIKDWFEPSVDTHEMQEEFSHPKVIKIKDKVLIDTPVIKQLPELPRGCEVTALAMLLQHAGIDIDKLTLAEQITKDPTPFRITAGEIYFGNPHDGFVGSISSFSEPGLGVYHGPIAELANRYLPGKVKDLTGSSFKELKIHLSDERPVWVIINTTYRKLPNSSFQTWHTPRGTIRITFKEHSVLITGYDENYVYFNEPLTGEKNKKTAISDFEEAWVQMGSQAITYLNE